MSDRKRFIDLTRRGQIKRLRKQVLNQHEEYIDALTTEPSSSQSDMASNTDLNVCESQTPTELSSSDDDLGLYRCEIPVLTQKSQRNNIGLHHEDISDLLNSFPDSDDDDDHDDYNKAFDFKDEKEKFSEELKNWCFQYHVTHVALTALLCILKSHKCFQTLPSDSRTLLKTPASADIGLHIKPVDPGSYYHFGIKAGIEQLWMKLKETVTINCIELLIGIDGLPLFRSGAGEFWPILLSIINIPTIFSQVIPIGIYFGKKKPNSNNTFLTALVEDLVHLTKNGVLLNGKRVLVNVKGFCCDAPAKSFILGIKGHTGYSSCTKCKQVGHYYCGRMTFPDIPKKEDLKRMLRTSRGFLSKEDPEFHNTDSILTNIPSLDFISSFPLDYMHLVCLGVTRTIIYIWIYAKPPLKFQFQIINSISVNLLSLRSFIPVEFSRKPRGLEDIKRWKATEFRQFLLYTGPLVLKKVLIHDKENIYNNFLHLHISMRILLSPKFCFLHKDYADELLSRFLHKFKILYGQQFMTHNFHNLLHLSEDVATFGSLDVCSAFRFENYLQSLKKLVRKGDKPLAQVVKRLLEKSNCSLENIKRNADQNYPYCSSPHCSGPLLSGCDISKQFKKLHFQDFTLSTTVPNSCCSLIDGSIGVLSNIVYCSYLKSLSIIFQKFLKYEEFFGHPFCSSSSLDIHLVSELSSLPEIVPVSQIHEKIVLLPAGDKTHLALPLLHIEK